jgi:peptidoglycan/xylan/chitin deacetylase (PgdA/CDA1 family)
MAAARVPVLMYHRVGEARDARESRYAIDPAGFASHMQALAAHGYRAVHIDAFVEWLEGGADLPEGAFLLTFDDGFLGVHDHAWQVLKALDWPFTVFLVSDRIGGGDEWIKRDDPSASSHPLLDVEHIRAMQAEGVSFQSHTRSHRSLTGLDDGDLRDELEGSRQALAAVLGRDVEYLAYPFGHADARVEAAARAAGYRVAFCTQAGFNRRDGNPFQIRRLDIFGTDSPATLLRKIRLGTSDGSLANAARYYVSRAKARLSHPR